MKKLLILILGLLIGVAGTVALARYQNKHQVVPFHEHADFALFLNGQKFDFGKEEFMNFEPCVAYEPSLLIPSALAHGGEGEDPKEFVHLHQIDRVNVGGVIHVHKAGIRYHDFFESLNMEFEDDRFVDNEGKEYENNEENSFRFFVNGKEVENIAETEIRNLDQTLITYGPKDRTMESIQVELAQITNDACLYSGSCSQRGLAAPDSCGGVVKKPFLLKWMKL